MRRPRRRAADGPNAAEWALLTDALQPDTVGDVTWFLSTDDAMRALDGRPPLRELWAAYREDVLREWIARRPGTRPAMWWAHAAPPWLPDEIPGRWRGAFFTANLKAPRERLGGIGTACHDALNYVPEFHRGIPAQWLDAEMAARFGGDALDPDDPPRYEAQAVYLARWDLLTPDEARLWTLGKLDTTPELVTCAEEAGSAADEGAETWQS